MITVAGTVTTPLPPEQAFAFLSEFENTSSWDSALEGLKKKLDSLHNAS